MTAPTFTKEQLEVDIRKLAMKIAARMHDGECPSYMDKVDFIKTQLAAFALAQIERIEMLEAERDVANGTACAEEQADGKGPCGVCRNCARAERDEARRELFEAEDAIREADRIMAAAETGEPRESIWRLIQSAKVWRLVQLAVLRARERGKRKL